MNLQKAIAVTDSTFLLCRARAEILRERREALLFFLCVSDCWLKMLLLAFCKSQCVGRSSLCLMRDGITYKKPGEIRGFYSDIRKKDMVIQKIRQFCRDIAILV
jgi:hypothetical protein